MSPLSHFVSTTRPVPPPPPPPPHSNFNNYSGPILSINSPAAAYLSHSWNSPMKLDPVPPMSELLIPKNVRSLSPQKSTVMMDGVVYPAPITSQPQPLVRSGYPQAQFLPVNSFAVLASPQPAVLPRYVPTAIHPAASMQPSALASILPVPTTLVDPKLNPLDSLYQSVGVTTRSMSSSGLFFSLSWPRQHGRRDSQYGLIDLVAVCSTSTAVCDGLGVLG